MKTREEISELLGRAVTERNRIEDEDGQPSQYLLGVYDTLQWVLYGAAEPEIEEEDEG